MKTIKGCLDIFFETGTEGLIWILDDGRKNQGYEAIHLIEEGDHLTVFDENDKKIFDDKIVCDTETGKIPRPTNPQFKQQSALGYWIHWVQEGWEPDEWAGLFIREDMLRAELTKKKTKIIRPRIKRQKRKLKIKRKMTKRT